MTSTKDSRRVSGLDLLRALAILLVLVAHYPKTHTGLTTRVLNFGWTGVDLFFVLSGYLIASQWFKPLGAEGSIGGERPSLTWFYARRFLRTLPAYYAVLLIYFVLDSPRPVSHFLLFTQNFGIPNTFAPSWSLCVEEQFYLLFPIFTLALMDRRLGSWAKPIALWTIPGLLVAEFAIRSAVWFHLRPDLLQGPQALSAYMGGLYYPTYCRLDGIVLGVGLATLKYFRPEHWQRLMQSGNRLLAWSGAAMTLAILALWSHYSYICSTAGFSVLNIAFALLTASALSPTCFLARWRVPGASFVALLSYSLYLTHSLALEAGSRFLPRVAVSQQSVIGIAATAATMLVFALVLYFLVERPSLDFRDRLLAEPRRPREEQMTFASGRPTGSSRIEKPFAQTSRAL
jgi:peptidoglycan/LPS O-acetylase OafA/YrhL